MTFLMTFNAMGFRIADVDILGMEDKSIVTEDLCCRV